MALDVDDYIALAKNAASSSKDPSTKVGAVLMGRSVGIVPPFAPGTVLAVGCNGFPYGIKEDERMLDRALKNELVVHAETRVLLQAGKRARGSIMFTTHPPCCRCAVNIIEAGVKHVITIKPTADMLSRWAESLQRARNLFEEAGVDYTELEDK